MTSHTQKRRNCFVYAVTTHHSFRFATKIAPFSLLMLFLVLLTGTMYAAPKVGPITPENAIVGGETEDNIGMDGVFSLPNGNLIIASPYWNYGRGAVTCLTPDEYRAGGIVISAANSLVGSTPSDFVGNDGIKILTNGNYVVRSGEWNSGTTQDVGAITWVNGDTCIPHGATSRGAAVSPLNSLVGSTTKDAIGVSGVVPLSNGHYVVGSELWDDGTKVNVGAVTWANGSIGMAGVVSKSNSLYGSTAHDRISTYYGVDPLPNGHYVVASRSWQNGAAAQAGAVTWGNGFTGTTGEISAANSLVGTSEGDQVGSGPIVVLSNGNYVFSSHYWDNQGVVDAGAVTWADAEGGTVGEISAANSLVGTSEGDQVGRFRAEPLTNGHYVAISPLWDNGSIVDAGAVTWGNGNGGTVGAVSTDNSLVGSSAGDSVGGTELADRVFVLSNGHYVVNSPYWDNGGLTDVGASTWANGEGGTVGFITAANSLVGSSPGDQVGGIIALSNGNYTKCRRGDVE